MVKYLVTGGTGFIGSYLVDALLSSDENVTVLTRSPNYEKQGVKVITYDLTKKLPPLNFDVVFHLAGAFSEDIYTTNINGTENLLNAIAFSASKFIFLSSAAVYGNVDSIPTLESHIPQPLDDYGKSKLMAEEFIRNFCALCTINPIIVRLFNCYGEGQEDKSFIPAIVSKILSNKRAFRDILPITRDFIHVSDVVTALILLAQGNNKGTFNLGTGVETSRNEVISNIVNLSGLHNVKVLDFNDPNELIIRSCANISKIKNIGWTPKVLLKDGLKKFYEFYNAKNR